MIRTGKGLNMDGLYMGWDIERSWRGKGGCGMWMWMWFKGCKDPMEGAKERSAALMLQHSSRIFDSC